jgi:hypothetical protein
LPAHPVSPNVRGDFSASTRETLNKSILAPLKHGFSRRGIDGYAFIQRIPGYFTQKIRYFLYVSILNEQGDFCIFANEKVDLFDLI